jgi:hypothetical protein
MKPIYYIKTPDEPFRYQVHGRDTRQWFRSIDRAKARAEELARMMTPMQPMQCLVEVTSRKGRELHAIIAEHQTGHEWRIKWYTDNAENFLNWELLAPPTDDAPTAVQCPWCQMPFFASQSL